MSLLLGIYSKKNEIGNEEFKEVLKDFSLNGKRRLQTRLEKKILLSSARKAIDYSNIVENEDRSLIILFGGKIYDFNAKVKDLIRRGHKFENEENDAEFILHSYEEFDASFLKEVAGTFAFVIYNRLEDKVTICNDNFGFYPLFIYDSGEYIIFSTEYEPITKYRKFDRILDYDSIAEYFCFAFPLGNKTFFKNIRNLPPSSVLEIEKQKMDLNKYDDLNIKINNTRELSTFAEEMSKIIKEAVRIRAENPKYFIYTLSGGADTRLILSNLTNEQRKSIMFLTDRNPNLREDEDRDLIITKMLAEKLKLRLKIKVKRTKAFGTSFFERMRICPEKESQALTGLHGGEFLGGFCYKMFPITIEKLSEEEIEQKLKQIFSNNFLRNISNPYISLKKEYEEIKAENKELFFIIQRICRGFFTGLYGGSRSGWLSPYRFSESHDSIFWDNNFLKFLLTIPKEFLIDYRLYNEIYKNHFRELLNVPTNSDIAKRKDSCMKFIEVGTDPKSARRHNYLRALKTYMKSHHTWDKNFYNEKYIKSLRNQEYHPIILPVTDFEAWYRAFVSNGHWIRHWRII